jgi:hypothetical protein
MSTSLERWNSTDVELFRMSLSAASNANIIAIQIRKERWIFTVFFLTLANAHCYATIAHKLT